MGKSEAYGSQGTKKEVKMPLLLDYQKIDRGKMCEGSREGNESMECAHLTILYNIGYGSSDYFVGVLGAQIQEPKVEISLYLKS